MPNLENARSRTVQAGLHILARIIAREVVKDRLAEMAGLESDPPSPGTLPVEAGE